MDQLAYLKELGVDIYLARQPLPGARPSRYELRPAATIMDEPVATRTAAGRPRRMDIGSVLEAPAPRAAGAKPRPAVTASPAQAANTARSAAVAFNLLVVPVSETALFVSELRSPPPLRPDLEANVLQFLQDVCCALGGPASEPLTPVYFQWPMTASNASLEQGEAAAKETLRGFLSQQLADYKPARLVLMGPSVAGYISDGDQLPAWLQSDKLRLIHGPSLGQLFAHPARKAELWSALQAR